MNPEIGGKDNPDKGIIVAGSLIADVFYDIDTYPGQGLLTNIRGVTKNVGGTGNLILDLAKLDRRLPVTVSAVIGTGANGKMILDTFSRYTNIITDNIARIGTTSVTLVMNARDTKQRTFFYQPASSDVYDESFINWDRIKGKIFHLEYLLLMKKVDADDEKYGTHGARILHDAKEKGMLTSIDVVSEQSMRAKKIVSAALKYTDICTVNEIEAEAVTGQKIVKDGQINPDAVLDVMKSIKSLGVKKWIVIHSPSCGYGYDCEREELQSVPSFNLPKGYIKGTNGAGDAYCSGILYGAYCGYDLARSMRLATSCAACSLSESNGTDGMRNETGTWAIEEELKNRLPAAHDPVS